MSKYKVREVALNILEKIEKNQSYSNLLLNQEIKTKNLDQKDVALLTELTYGTLQRRMTLDYYLSPFIKGKKVKPWVRQLLRLTVYQMYFLDKIPDRAAIYEAVEIGKKRGHKAIGSFINGILRNLQREGPPSLDNLDDIERLSIYTSHPKWLVERWVNQFGFEKTKEICEANLTAPVQTARVNVTKICRDECMKQLAEEGFHVEASLIVDEGIKCLKGNLAHSSLYQKGYFTIQDESSMLVAYALGVKENEYILDACAAPGGKSTHIAERLNNRGKVISVDLHEHKVKLIGEQASRLSLSNIETFAYDSRKIQEKFPRESFDRILLDAPCSGLGVIRRKPDVKYQKSPEDIMKLREIQLQLLRAVSPLLKKGGTIVYSTCTIDKDENEQVVKQFLKEHDDFIGDEQFKERMPEAIQPLCDDFSLQLLPTDIGSDGFYIACLKRKV